MDNNTFGLTGVNLTNEQNQSQQNLKQQQQTQRTSRQQTSPLLTHKNQEFQKSISKLPLIEIKNAPKQPMLIQNERVQLENRTQTHLKQSQSESKIENLRYLIDQENINQKKQLQNQRNNQKRNYKTHSEIQKTQTNSFHKRQDQEFQKMKEKRKVLDIYKQQIVQDFDTLYEKDTEKKIITKLQNLEKKQKLQQELKRNESILSNELKSYNTIKYEIKKKKQEYDNLLNQLNNCDFVFTQEKDRNELEKLKQTQEDLVQKLNDSQNIQMSLKHMSDTRKKLILFEKKQVEQLYEEYQKQCKILNKKSEKQISFKQKLENLSIQQKNQQKLNSLALPERFKEHLEDQLSQFEDKRSIQEIFKHENKRKEEQIQKEQMRKKEELKQQKLEKEKQAEKIKAEKKVIEQDLANKKKKIEDLLKVSFVSNITALEAHKNFMEQTIQELKEFQVYFQSQIDNQKQQNQQKKSLLENLKFVQNQRRASISIQEKDVEKSEKILIQENSKLQEAQQKVRRLEKIIDQICLVQSRINYQLQPKNLKNKNAEVKREELIDQITLSGLKLEKIVAFLAKKKDPQRVESINTDADYHKPPEYIGINPLNYTKYWENQNINNLNEDKFMFQQNENDEDQYQNTIRKQILVNNNSNHINNNTNINNIIK